MSQALSGIRVIDMTHNQAGPAWLWVMSMTRMPDNAWLMMWLPQWNEWIGTAYRAAAGWSIIDTRATRELALAHFHPRVLLVDDVNPPAATHHAAVLVAHFGRPQAVTNSHGKCALSRTIEGAGDRGPRARCQARHPN